MRLEQLEAIFSRQRELFDKYHEIELMSGLVPNVQIPLDLNQAQSQMLIKDYVSRFVEEIGEALEISMWPNRVELIDGLHFLIELSIIVDLSPEKIFLSSDGLANDIDYDSHSMYLLQTIINLGVMCNQLKKKPWKKDWVDINPNQVSKLYSHLTLAWQNYLMYLQIFMSSELIVDTYMDKAIINQKRQEGEY